jgi:hypothetical protein
MQIEGRDANSHNTNSSGGATVTVGREAEWVIAAICNLNQALDVHIIFR